MSSFRKLSGTPFYLAPEALKGTKTPKSDIWSIGVIMYVLLSGHLPFVSDHEDTVFHKAIEGKFSMDQQIWQSISKEAKDLIRKMINTNTSKRYTATECLNHEWFTVSDNTTSEPNANKDLVNNLKLIRSKTLMQNVAYKFIKKIMNKADLQNLHEKFAEVASGTDKIPITTFREAISSVYPDFTKDEVDRLITDILQTQKMTTKINYIDFLAELDNITEYNQDTKAWITSNTSNADISTWGR